MYNALRLYFRRENTVRRYNRATNLFYKPIIFPTTTARQGNFTVRKDNFTHFFRNNPEKVKAPGLRRPGAFLCSLKNEGYNYESLFRLALRRVEQLYSDGCGSVFLSTLILNNANMKTV